MKTVMRKGIGVVTAGLAAAVLVSGAALAADPSVEMGKALFSDPKLGGGKSGKSCNSCHVGGKGMDKAAGRKDLADIINQCIEGPLGGKALGGKSVEMGSLKLYIDSLGGK